MIDNYSGNKKKRPCRYCGLGFKLGGIHRHEIACAKKNVVSRRAEDGSVIYPPVSPKSPIVADSSNNLVLQVALMRQKISTAMDLLMLATKSLSELK